MDVRLTFGEWLNDLMHRRGIGQREMADALGVSQGTISNWWNEVTFPTRKNARDLARFLEMDVTELQQRIDASRRAKRVRETVKGGKFVPVPFRGRVPASLDRWGVTEEQGREVEIPERWVKAARSDLFVVEVSGDCLAADEIYDGMWVVCEKVTDTSAITQGKIVLVRVGGEVTLKHWYWMGENQAELRDGDGNVVARIHASDEVQIEGIARHRFIAEDID